jgi:glutamine amidotransferase
MIGVVDIGTGNLRSVLLAVQKCKGRAAIAKASSPLGVFDGLILPGVGSFAALKGREAFLGSLRAFAASGKPVLGICLGMQALFQESEEAPGISGLGLLEGKVRKIPGKVRLPQMGWNKLEMKNTCALLEGIPNNTYAYFANSYSCEPADATIVAATAEYGSGLVAAVCRGNIFGVQFHPEKSGEAGLRVIRNFVEQCR